ncbi:hypothetical protein GCM10010435_44350 [Winogradskya consettensis]|uniref:Uncharacterized protein n=1 Tax=Winogradskya consettensis TaxID=113560 RepID=A0A919W694_9ACTN|nr:hypothetical protein [Actinoplanes consettensis]GIM82682.1 hypothetical protein Aco04nite_82740 [Actinoplanes consettensis]
MAVYSQAGKFGPALISGAPVGVPLRVTDQTGAGALLYADSSKNKTVSPIVYANDAGLVTFFADPGSYTVRWSGGSAAVTATGGVVDTGPVAPAPVAVARKYKTGNQAATTNFVVAVTLDTLEYNRDATVFDTSVADVIKVLKPGPYLVTASVNFVGGTSGDRTGLITVNGAVAKEFGLAGTDSRPAAADVLVLAADAAIGLSVYTVGGTSINGSVPKDVVLAVTRLGA